MSLNQLRTGFSRTAKAAEGVVNDQRGGNQGEMIVSELHGRYAEATISKTVFGAANAAGATTTVGVATTYTGLAISNPVGSGVNVLLNKVGFAFLLAFPAAAAIGIMVGFNATTNVTHTTPVTPGNNFLGQVSGLALVDAACTFPTAPVLRTILATGLTGAVTTEAIATAELIDLEGSILLPPGGYAALYTSTASGAASLFGSFSWEEIPV